jgi:hypothetical protein
MASMHRPAAAIVAIAAWAGLGIQFAATLTLTGSAGEALLIILRYFTVITNLLVAIVMTVLALGRPVRPMVLGGTTLAIILVAVVYMLLLRGLVELSGGAILADTLLHKVVPLLAVAYWLAFAPKGGLRLRDPLLWVLYPLTYLGYALVRGAFEGRYAYPFMDVATLGLARTATNCAVIAGGFVVAGLAMVALDRALARNAG